MEGFSQTRCKWPLSSSTHLWVKGEGEGSVKLWVRERVGVGVRVVVSVMSRGGVSLGVRGVCG